MSFSNIPPPQGMPELVAILDVVQNADKLRAAVQQIMDALDRANATRKQASEEVEAAMTEAAMVRREAEQARDEMLTAATLEAQRIRAEAQAVADESAIERRKEHLEIERIRQELAAGQSALREATEEARIKALDLADQSASLKRREDALREREAKLKELVG